ncbi:uncharacterized protein LOC120897938 isoform X2 [Anopheles arabiensis]|uniref:uncharacterized protein LOC120897938 isoform X2 n=1 Tax=Anopheles arabiensis TaxID=7173 RepID=UPI001AAD86EC|nr:uncharacterized protein LOC120897938 isoform X2 [Anopheles arabiensis]
MVTKTTAENKCVTVVAAAGVKLIATMEPVLKCVPCFHDSYALTKDELNKYIDDPWWIKMRYCCFATCWIVCLIALAISLYIAADALQHDVCLTPLTNNGTSLGPADLSISTNAIPLVADGAVSTPPSSIVFTLLNQPTS